MRPLLSAATGLIVLAFVSRVLGFLRESALAAVFGSDWRTDAYFVANVIPIVVFQAITAAIFANYIPISIRIEKEQGTAGWLDFTHRAMSALIVWLLSLGLLTWLFAPYLVRVLAPGFSPEGFDLAVRLTRLLVPAMCLQGFVGFAGAVLNAKHRFLGASIVFLLYNLGLILGTFILGPKGGLEYVILVIDAITLLQAIIIAHLLRRLGYIFHWQWAPKDRDLHRMIYLAAPTIVGSVTAQVNVIIDRILASFLAPGTVSALSFADKINALPVFTFAIPIATVTLPTVARCYSADASSDRGILALVIRDLRRTTFLILPFSIAFFLLARDIVALLFQYGAFTTEDTKATAAALACFSLGLVFWGWREVLIKALLALEETRIPMVASVMGMVTNAVLSCTLVRWLGHQGLALAFSAGMMVNSLYLLTGFQRRLGTKEPLIKSWIWKLLLAGTLQGVALAGVLDWADHDGSVIFVGAAGVGGLLAYAVGCAVLGLEEARRIIRLVPSLR